MPYSTALTAVDDTTVLGTDYSSGSNTDMETATFNSGDVTTTVTYMISKDTTIEDLETFTLTLALSGATDTAMFATVISPTATTVYILDCTGT